MRYKQSIDKSIDEVNYAIPFGVFGQIAHYFYVKKELEYIFRYRNEIINQLFT